MFASIIAAALALTPAHAAPIHHAPAPAAPLSAAPLVHHVSHGFGPDGSEWTSFYCYRVTKGKAQAAAIERLLVTGDYVARDAAYLGGEDSALVDDVLSLRAFVHGKASSPEPTIGIAGGDVPVC